MKCPLCRSDSERVFEVKNFWIRDCAECSHRFTELQADENHVEKIYGDSYFNGGGAGYADYLQEAEILRRRGNWYGRLLSKYMNAGSVLDIGSAAGFVLQGMRDAGWKAVGIEPNEAMAEYGRKNLNLEIHPTSVEKYQTDEKFDLVMMIQVIAHFVEPQDVFGCAGKMLEASGHLLIETWNRKSFSEKIFGAKWHEYSPPSVLHFFSMDGIERLAKENGFERVAVGRPSKWIGGAHAKSLLAYKFGEKSVAVKLLKLIPDKINFPYPAEDLFWVLYKKN